MPMKYCTAISATCATLPASTHTLGTDGVLSNTGVVERVPEGKNRTNRVHTVGSISSAAAAKRERTAVVDTRCTTAHAAEGNTYLEVPTDMIACLSSDQNALCFPILHR